MLKCVKYCYEVHKLKTFNLEGNVTLTFKLKAF